MLRKENVYWRSIERSHWACSVLDRSIIPVVMAGVLGIYGLITAVIINGKISSDPASYSAYSGSVERLQSEGGTRSFFGL